MVEFHFNWNNIDLLPPKPRFTFRNLKKGVQEFHRMFVLATTDNAALQCCGSLKNVQH